MNGRRCVFRRCCSKTQNFTAVPIFSTLLAVVTNFTSNIFHCTWLVHSVISSAISEPARLRGEFAAPWSVSQNLDPITAAMWQIVTMSPEGEQRESETDDVMTEATAGGKRENEPEQKNSWDLEMLLKPLEPHCHCHYEAHHEHLSSRFCSRLFKPDGISWQPVSPSDPLTHPHMSQLETFPTQWLAAISLKGQTRRTLTLRYTFAIAVTWKSWDSSMNPDACPAQKTHGTGNGQCHLNHLGINVNLHVECRSCCQGGKPPSRSVEKCPCTFLAWDRLHVTPQISAWSCQVCSVPDGLAPEGVKNEVKK